jgi:hypothetical protein
MLKLYFLLKRLRLDIRSRRLPPPLHNAEWEIVSAAQEIVSAEQETISA